MRPIEPAAGVPATSPVAMGAGWVALLIVIAGFNLRPLLTSLGATLELVRQDLGISGAAVGLLASLPTFCMGLVSLQGGRLIARLGTGAGMKLSLLLVAIGSAARWAGLHPPVLFAATVIGGLGIACGQVLIPVVVKQYFPACPAVMMGGYTTAMNLGAAGGAAATPVLMHHLGNWRAALAVWAVPALLAALLWPGGLRSRPEPARGLPWSRPLAWRLALFVGASSIPYMSLLAWLVPFFTARGMEVDQAVALLTVFAGTQILAALVIPLLAHRFADRRVTLALTLTLLMIGLVGFAVAPDMSPACWTVCAGVGLGGSFPLAMTLPLDYASTPPEAGRLSALMMGAGMLIGACGPALFGVLRDIAGFSVAMLLLLASATLAFALAQTFRPPRFTEPWEIRS